MAKNPIIFAMANPDPEISYEEAHAARPDVIMATGRSDYPNQVNNVLGFPFIFRGALDCRRHPDQRGDEARGLEGARRPREGGRSRLGRPGLRRRALPLRPGVPHPEAVRLARPAVGGAGGGRGGRLDRRGEASRSRTSRPTAESSKGCSRGPARFMQVIHEKARRARSGSSSPRGTTRRSSAPPRSWSRRGSPSRSSSSRGEMRRRRSEPRREGARQVIDPEEHPRFTDVRRGLLREAEAPGRDEGGRPSHDAREELLRPDDGREGDADVALSGLTHVLPGDDPPGAPGDRHGARGDEGLGPLHPDPPGARLLLRRHDGQHRPDGRGPRRDRDPVGRRGEALRHHAARGDDLLLELRVDALPGDRQGAQGGPDREAAPSGPRVRRRDAGRHGRSSGVPEGRISVGGPQRPRRTSSSSPSCRAPTPPTSWSGGSRKPRRSGRS